MNIIIACLIGYSVFGYGLTLFASEISWKIGLIFVLLQLGSMVTAVGLYFLVHTKRSK